MTSTASASADLLGLLLAYLSSRGLDSAALLEVSGIDAALREGSSPEARIPFERFAALLSRAADACADPDLGLRFGETARRFPSGHLLHAVMMNSPGVTGALERFFRFHGLMSDAVIPRLERTSAHADILIEPSQPGLSIGRRYIDISLAACLTFLRQLVGQRLRPLEVRLAYPPPESTAEHGRVFGCALRFDQPVSGLRFEAGLLDRPLEHADAELLAILERTARARLERVTAPVGWMSKTRRSILRSLLAGDRPDVEAVARDLAVSVRRLQGELRGEQTTYKQVLDAVRFELAKEYLQQAHLSLCEVAFLLGYAEQSSFNHAFKRWTGVTPLEYRANG